MVSTMIQDQIALEKLQAFLQTNALPFNDIQLEGSIYFTYQNDEKQVIASGGLELFGDSALLRSVAVAPQERGKKLGNQVVQDLLTKARSLGVHQLYLLTETAERYFEARGFKKITRELAPEAIANSSEFKTVCPASAVCMIYKMDLVETH